MGVDKESLFAPRASTGSGLPEDDVDIPGLGTVHVRGLTRGEVFAVQQAKTTAAMERKILSLGLLDPELTEVEVGRWQEASPAGEIEDVANKIRDLSGLNEGSEKEAMLNFRDDAGG